MKILIRNSDNVVMYADDSMVLSIDGVKGSGWVDYNFTTANSTLTDAKLPENWTGAVYTYTKGDLAVFDQAAIDDRAKSIADAAKLADREAAIKKAREAAIEKLLLADPAYAAALAQ